MALNKITYDNKVSLNPQPSIANVNKVSDADMNEIKSVVNAGIDQLNDKDDNWKILNSTIKYKKSGNIITITGYSSGTTTLSIDDYNTVGTLPEGYRPQNMLYDVWNEIGTDYCNTYVVGINGNIALYSTKATNYWCFTLTYII